MQKTVSEYNAGHNFEIEFKESRLKNCIQLISNLNPGVLLDIGCADGKWMKYWEQAGWKTYGIEVSIEAVNKAVKSGLKARVCDLTRQKIPFKNNYFDLIFAGEVIEHLIDTDSFLKDVNRCLKKDGHLIITTPNLASFENRVRLLVGKYPRWLDFALMGSGHVRGYTPEILKKQLNAHEFQVLKHKGNWIPFIPQSVIDDVKAPWLAFTGNIYPNLAMDIIILAKKKN